MRRLSFLGAMLFGSAAAASTWMPGELQTPQAPVVEEIRPLRVGAGSSVTIRIGNVGAVRLEYRRLMRGQPVLARYTPLVKLTDEGNQDHRKGEPGIEYLQLVTDAWLDATDKGTAAAQYCLVLDGKVLNTDAFWVDPVAGSLPDHATVLEEQHRIAASRIKELLGEKAGAGAKAELFATLWSLEAIPPVTTKERSEIDDALLNNEITLVGQVEATDGRKIVIHDAELTVGEVVDRVTSLQSIEVQTASDTTCTVNTVPTKCGEVSKLKGMRARIVGSVRKLGSVVVNTIDFIVPGE